MRAAKIAALDAQNLHIEDGRRLTPSFPKSTIADLFRGMRELGVTTLYVHRSALGPMGLPASLTIPKPGERRTPHPFVAGVRFEGERVSQRALAPSTECRGLEVMIGAYQDGAGDPFEDAADGLELLAAHQAFRDAFTSKQYPRGWTFRHSAIFTGWNLMHAPWRRGARAHRLEAMGMDARELPTLYGADGLQVEVPYGSWARDEAIDAGMAGAPHYAPHVLAWDINGQRLAACSRLSLGIGGLEKRPDGRPFDKALPGYHYVSSVSNPHEGRIPPIFAPGWHTTPRVAMAHYLGLDVNINLSIVYTQHLPYLDPFYEAMRNARTRLLDQIENYAGGTTLRNEARRVYAAKLALGALKQCYLQPLGRLRSHRARESGDTYYRPHWYDTVIGQELAREYLRLFQFAEAGVPVLAVYFDTIIVESSEADPVRGAPMMLSSQLGKYKPVGSLPTARARRLLYSEGVGALVKALKVPRQAPPVARAWERPTHGGYCERVTLGGPYV